MFTGGVWLNILVVFSGQGLGVLVAHASPFSFGVLPAARFQAGLSQNFAMTGLYFSSGVILPLFVRHGLGPELALAQPLAYFVTPCCQHRPTGKPDGSMYDSKKPGFPGFFVNR